MTRSGFLLNELMIYLVLSALCIHIVFTWFWRLYSPLYFINHACVQLAHCNAACSVMKRDLRSAPPDYRQWKLVSDDALIWHTQTGDIGIVLHKGNIVRIEGIYDAEQEVWRKKSVSHLVFHVKEFRCTLQRIEHYITRVSLVFLLYGSDEKKVLDVALRIYVV